MRKFKAVGLIFLLFACIAAALVYSISSLGPKVGNTFSTISNSLPGDTAPVPGLVESLPPFFSSPSGGGAGPLDEVDSLLQSSMSGSLAYNAPPEMDLQETVKIHLVLSPNQSEEELKKQVTEPGSVFSSDNIKLTDKMEAKLIPADPDAFTIQELQESRQLVTNVEPTNWYWQVMAKKSGKQKLSLVVYRVVEYQGEELTRVVKEFESDIDVKVSPQSRIPWAGILLALLLVSAAGGWLLFRNSRKEAAQAPGRSGHPRVAPRGRTSQGNIFLSYRRSDSADIAGRIYDGLVAEFGREPIFKDVDSIPLGVDFRQILARKVSECKVLLAIIGDEWAETRDENGNRRLDDPDDFVRIEIESALTREIPVIPLLVRGAKMPAAEHLPPSLHELVYKNGMPVRPDPDFHHDMNRLISALEQILRSD